MNMENNTYDVAVIGGGLAGLATSIQLARKGYSIIVIEKEKYPFHKVCGEYISLESYAYLQESGLPLQHWQLPQIDQLIITAPAGHSFKTSLPLGGVGISRYLLDQRLCEQARMEGVTILEQTKAEEVNKKELFFIQCSSQTKGNFTICSKICCAAYGKKSNLDVKWKREKIKQEKNYIAVKYHIRTDWPKNLIGLHNFKDGYCGISAIEDDKYCLCYMTTADNLKHCKNNIEHLQQSILFKNPHLKAIFSNSIIDDPFPVTISQINFCSKSTVENGILMLGDAAGMITPLCGNGMSIALHTSKIASILIHNYLSGTISAEQLGSIYHQQWNKSFSSRLKAGRTLQHFFGNIHLSNGFVHTLRTLPFIAAPVIRLTHGKPF